MKEKLVTILLGLAAGTVFGGLILLGPKIMENKISLSLPKSNPQPTVSAPEPTPKQSTPQTTIKTSDQSLTIDSPDNFYSTTQTPVTITGKAPPQSQVIIVGPAEEKVASSSADGIYSVKLQLEDGENEISASIFGDKFLTVKKTVFLEIAQ